jgi:hypothetical protein
MFAVALNLGFVGASSLAMVTNKESYDWGESVSFTVSGYCSAGLTCGSTSMTQHNQPVLYYADHFVYGGVDLYGRAAYAWNVLDDFPMPGRDSVSYSVTLPAFSGDLKSTTPDGHYSLGLWNIGDPVRGIPPHIQVQAPFVIGSVQEETVTATTVISVVTVTSTVTSTSEASVTTTSSSTSSITAMTPIPELPTGTITGIVVLAISAAALVIRRKR